MSSLEANRLARICAYSADAPEWEKLVRIVTPVVSLAARRVCGVWGDKSTASVHELVQEVFLKLCEDERRILRDFASRDKVEFLQLLRVITARVGSDRYRKLTAEKRGGSLAAIPLEHRTLAADMPDELAARALETASLRAQLDGLLRLYPKQVSARDRQLFWLHFDQGLSPKAISSIASMGLTTDGVESALVRLTRLLRETVVHGKPKAEPEKQKSARSGKINGISAPIAINNIERR